ncbi:MAG TPA: type II toxin-antitoxin system RelE/ParE family toxin [Solirubrobacterales bacterium]
MRPILRVDKYVFIALTEQAERYLLSLDEGAWKRFDNAARSLVLSFETGRPAAGRTEKIRNSAPGLFELRIDLAGRPGPQHRLICARDGKRVLCVRGFTKDQPKLPRGEIEIAAREITAFRRRSPT